MSRRPRLLVAEDDSDIRDILAHTLAADGTRDVVAVENGRTALEAIQAQPFDLVILDVLMPELSGLQVLERMRGMPEGRDVPVLVLTALDDRDTVVRALRAGADDRLTKPFDPVLLRTRVAAALERERRRADELLHAIMPAPAVAELKASSSSSGSTSRTTLSAMPTISSPLARAPQPLISASRRSRSAIR
jgi:DNA-binding response OmpR family regulator